MADVSGIKHLRPWASATYQIRVEGALDESWSDRFGGMRIEMMTRKDQTSFTTLTGRLVDQSELTGVLNGLAEMHLPILSVECVSLEPENTEAL
ncbi:MAG: hypothetical protein N839_0005650 [Desulfofustis sp. PB-SRB1]|jgi:hypothetical protein|nr:hypothetical protein [Desulfofustis sp. PB-SRB1]MBM1001881.1 hypothetical protein [Desulfofustis sp. PB-SRB1]HBH29851.1 hypothetical protein [Desulfofustis sp.]HBH30832.1 hypothetical protein [Desulfofustis sp.]